MCNDDIMEKISACLHDLEFDEQLPALICANCLEELDKFFDFRNRCLRSEFLLNGYIDKFFCSKDRSTFVNTKLQVNVLKNFAASSKLQDNAQMLKKRFSIPVILKSSAKKNLQSEALPKMVSSISIENCVINLKDIKESSKINIPSNSQNLQDVLGVRSNKSNADPIVNSYDICSNDNTLIEDEDDVFFEQEEEEEDYEVHSEGVNHINNLNLQTGNFKRKAINGSNDSFNKKCRHETSAKDCTAEQANNLNSDLLQFDMRTDITEHVKTQKRQVQIRAQEKIREVLNYQERPARLTSPHQNKKSLTCNSKPDKVTNCENNSKTHNNQHKSASINSETNKEKNESEGDAGTASCSIDLTECINDNLHHHTSELLNVNIQPVTSNTANLNYRNDLTAEPSHSAEKLYQANFGNILKHYLTGEIPANKGKVSVTVKSPNKRLQSSNKKPLRLIVPNSQLILLKKQFQGTETKKAQLIKTDVQPVNSLLLVNTGHKILTHCSIQNNVTSPTAVKHSSPHTNPTSQNNVTYGVVPSPLLSHPQSNPAFSIYNKNFPLSSYKLSFIKGNHKGIINVLKTVDYAQMCTASSSSGLKENLDSAEKSQNLLLETKDQNIICNKHFPAFDVEATNSSANDNGNTDTNKIDDKILPLINISQVNKEAALQPHIKITNICSLNENTTEKNTATPSSSGLNKNLDNAEKSEKETNDRSIKSNKQFAAFDAETINTPVNNNVNIDTNKIDKKIPPLINNSQTNGEVSLQPGIKITKICSLVEDTTAAESSYIHLNSNSNCSSFTNPNNTYESVSTEVTENSESFQKLKQEDTFSWEPQQALNSNSKHCNTFTAGTLLVGPNLDIRQCTNNVNESNSSVLHKMPPNSSNCSQQQNDLSSRSSILHSKKKTLIQKKNIASRIHAVKLRKQQRNGTCRKRLCFAVDDPLNMLKVFPVKKRKFKKNPKKNNYITVKKKNKELFADKSKETSCERKATKTTEDSDLENFEIDVVTVLENKQSKTPCNYVTTTDSYNFIRYLQDDERLTKRQAEKNRRMELMRNLNLLSSVVAVDKRVLLPSIMSKQETMDAAVECIRNLKLRSQHLEEKYNRVSKYRKILQNRLKLLHAEIK